jgi:Uma2 family endonuclease
MPAETLVSVEEYLSTAYHPDRDYVDGELLERNMGEYDHGWTQLAIGSWLWVRAAGLHICPLTKVRLQVTATRFRIPDIMVLSGDAPRDPIIRTAPLLCIEILSRDDTMRAIMGRIQDYLAMSVPVCWIVDPIDRVAWIAESNGLHDVKDGVLRAGHISLPLSDIWPNVVLTEP